MASWMTGTAWQDETLLFTPHPHYFRELNCVGLARVANLTLDTDRWRKGYNEWTKDHPGNLTPGRIINFPIVYHHKAGAPTGSNRVCSSGRWTVGEPEKLSHNFQTNGRLRCESTQARIDRLRLPDIGCL